MTFIKKAEDTSYITDFIRGIEPTGKWAFKSGLTNKNNHQVHKFFGDLGGLVSGAAITTALSGLGMIAAGKIYKNQPNLSKILEESGKDMFYLLNPKKAVDILKAYPKSADITMSQIKSSGRVMDNIAKLKDAELPLLLERMGPTANKLRDVASGKTTLRELIGELDFNDIKNTKDVALATKHSKEIVKDILEMKKSHKDFVEANGDTPINIARKGSAITAGLIAAAFGGLTNVITNRTQYNSGLEIKKKLKEKSNELL